MISHEFGVVFSFTEIPGKEIGDHIAAVERRRSFAAFTGFVAPSQPTTPVTICRTSDPSVIQAISIAGTNQPSPLPTSLNSIIKLSHGLYKWNTAVLRPDVDSIKWNTCRRDLLPSAVADETATYLLLSYLPTGGIIGAGDSVIRYNSRSRIPDQVV